MNALVPVAYGILRFAHSGRVLDVYGGKHDDGAEGALKSLG